MGNGYGGDSVLVPCAGGSPLPTGYCLPVADNSLEWITLGDGTFDNVNIIDPVYTPGVYDIEIGTSTLTLTAYGNNGNIANSMVLEIISLLMI